METPPAGKTAPVTASRHSELLRIARKSRIFWVLEARDAPRKISDGNAPGPAGAAPAGPEKKMDKLAHIPAALSIQQVLDFFNNLIDDGNVVDLDSLLLSLDTDTDDVANDTLLESFTGDLPSYEVFLKKLLHPGSGTLLQAVQLSCQALISLARDSKQKDKDMSTVIFRHIDQCVETMNGIAIFNADDAANLEKFLFKKLYPHMFNTEDPQNARTHERITTLQFINAVHLDIRSFAKLRPDVRPDDALSVVLAQPVRYLLGLQDAHSPADKLTCLRQTSSAIAGILQKQRGDGSMPGADELLPTMILTINLANPIHVHSHIRYLERYIRPSKLTGEAGYLLTNFISAVGFLDGVDAAALTIDPDEFHKEITAARAKGKAAVSKASTSTSPATAGSAGAGAADKVWDVTAALAEYKSAMKSNRHREFVSIHDA